MAVRCFTAWHIQQMGKMKPQQGLQRRLCLPASDNSKDHPSFWFSAFTSSFSMGVRVTPSLFRTLQIPLILRVAFQHFWATSGGLAHAATCGKHGDNLIPSPLPAAKTSLSDFRTEQSSLAPSMLRIQLEGSKKKHPKQTASKQWPQCALPCWDRPVVFLSAQL